MGFETPEEGYLAKILVPAGTKDVPVGKPVCVICENETDIGSFANFEDKSGSSVPKMPVSPTLSTPSTPPQPPTPTPSTVTPAPATPAPVTPAPVTSRALTEKGRVYASPMAKNLAEKKNLRLEDVGKGSGIYGSVKVADLQMLKDKTVSQQLQSATFPPYEDHPISGMRSAIAKKLLQSKQISPHFYTSVECVMDEVLLLKSKLNAVLEKEKLKLTVNDFVVKATALATKKVPAANSAWLETVIRRYKSVDVCVAVSIKSGLITPIVFGADTKGLIEISENIKTLSKKARDGTLQPQEYQGGTITVSNMGMYGVLHFCPIINPPQTCILGVGSSHEKFVPVNKVGVVKNVMVVTLSADHRVVDGAIAAQWLRAFREFIEDPHKMLL
ncbi:dihydrolipoyllysine-residue acetyltransferase component of pyruvate dehydrogenase complex, mitochondrial [Cimex lectularius]|uniref:Dihydrolipoyllysine-residue acetyltransferase n=1 Tax=Cimex lectularius TaxID=79782 RepID=A0A8I6S4T3_CIMLE|nr:dihydrolipoyllysine-residue acetyltransferase component of pyruvate dehydrogenase complex, mitochondrial [Cimex lectularius]